ncbi:MAG: hypothetical protein JWN71_2881 [Xanthobacteraceae bacterium]|nr:hypothetical protein [Xanthobacteraceae bacterium]
MLVYHPALDVNHGMFRMLRLLEINPLHTLQWDTFRILDFYYLFPHLLKDASLPSKMTKIKNELAKLGSQYTRVPTPKVFIQQILGIHESVARSLIGKGFIDATSFEDKHLKRTPQSLPPDLMTAFAAASNDEQLVTMLAVEIAAIPLSGPRGLKQRTGLLEHRYDAA